MSRYSRALRGGDVGRTFGQRERRDLDAGIAGLANGLAGVGERPLSKASLQMEWRKYHELSVYKQPPTPSVNVALPYSRNPPTPSLLRSKPTSIRAELPPNPKPCSFSRAVLRASSDQFPSFVLCVLNVEKSLAVTSIHDKVVLNSFMGSTSPK